MTEDRVPTEQDVRLWLWNGCVHDGKYGDDGELQCRGADFRRDPLPALIVHIVTAASEQPAPPLDVERLIDILDEAEGDGIIGPDYTPRRLAEYIAARLGPAPSRSEPPDVKPAECCGHDPHGDAQCQATVSDWGATRTSGIPCPCDGREQLLCERYPEHFSDEHRARHGAAEGSRTEDRVPTPEPRRWKRIGQGSIEVCWACDHQMKDGNCPIHGDLTLLDEVAQPAPPLDVERLIEAEKNTEGPAFPMSEFLPRLAAEYERLARDDGTPASALPLGRPNPPQGPERNDPEPGPVDRVGRGADHRAE